MVMKTFGDQQLVTLSTPIGEHPIARITMNDASGFNVMDRAMMRALTQAFDEVSAGAVDTSTGEGIRCVVLQAEGSAFSAGVDIGNLGDILDTGYSREWSPFDAIAECPIPVIACVNGPTITGGMEIVLLCDLVIVGPGAVFMDNHPKYGLHPVQGMSWRLAKAVGTHNAKLMTLASYPVDAETALRWGLAQFLVENDELSEKSEELARMICENHPLMVARYLDLHEKNSRGSVSGPDIEFASDATYYDCLLDVHAVVEAGANRFRQLLVGLGENEARIKP